MTSAGGRVVIRTRRLTANGLSFTLDEAGEGDAVALCLHGFPESRIAWAGQLPLLAELGWRAVAPDLRGYGDSDRPSGRRAYRIEHLVEDAAALFEALGARRRLLIGHDWGGVVAMAYAMSRAAPLDGLVVMNAPHPARFRQALMRSWPQRGRSWYMTAFQLPGLAEIMLGGFGAAGLERAIRSVAAKPCRVPTEALAVYRRNACQPGALRAMVDYYRANAGWLLTGQPWPRIETPTLIVWGEADKALGLELTQGLEPHFAALTVRRLPGVSHWVQEETGDEVNAILSGWLEVQGWAAEGRDAASD